MAHKNSNVLFSRNFSDKSQPHTSPSTMVSSRCSRNLVSKKISVDSQYSPYSQISSSRCSPSTMTSYSRRSRYSPSLSPSPSPYRRHSRSLSRSLSRSISRSRSRRHSRSLSRSLSRSISRSRSRSTSRDAENRGNNLYVTGLSPRITKRELEKHFAAEGKVVDVHLVVDPWTRESRGFGFVTMASLEEADRCVKNLNRSVLEGRVIMVEKARRRRGRTPTPGKYLGLRTIQGRRRSPSYSPCSSLSNSPYRRSYSRSPYSSDRSSSRSYSPEYRRRRTYSPDYRRRRAYSPYYSRRRSYYRYDRHRSYSRSPSPCSRSPVSMRDRSYSPYGPRYVSPDDSYYRRYRYKSVSRSVSPRPRRSRRSYSRSASPVQSVLPRLRKRPGRSHSRNSRSGGYYKYKHSRSISSSVSASSSSRSFSRSSTPGFTSPSN